MTIYDAEVIYTASKEVLPADGTTPKQITVASGKLQAITSLQITTPAAADVLAALIDQDDCAAIVFTIPAGSGVMGVPAFDLLALLVTVQEPYLWIRPDKYYQLGMPVALESGTALTITGTYYQFAALPALPV